MESVKNIKVGDILVCKKSYLFLFKKGAKYLITDIRYDYDLNDHKIVLSSDTNGQYWFLLSNIENEFFIYKWFYGVSYERKKKMKKLNELSKKNINMQKYWKVHIRNFDDFVEYLNNKYNLKIDTLLLESYKDCYNYMGNHKTILYFCIYGDKDEYYFSYNNYQPRNIEWFSKHEYIYCGEFTNRKKKLERLNKVFE